MNPSHCSLIVVELSLYELITLLVDLLFELILVETVECRLPSILVCVPSSLTKLPPKIVTFEALAKKAMMRRSDSEVITQQVGCGLIQRLVVRLMKVGQCTARLGRGGCGSVHKTQACLVPKPSTSGPSERGFQVD